MSHGIHQVWGNCPSSRGSASTCQRASGERLCRCELLQSDGHHRGGHPRILHCSRRSKNLRSASATRGSEQLHAKGMALRRHYRCRYGRWCGHRFCRKGFQMSLSPERELREERLQQIRRAAQNLAERASPMAPKSISTAGNGHHTLSGFEPANAASAQTGYYGMPLLKTPAWTWEVPAYFFVGGAAGTAAMLASVGKLCRADRDLIHDARCVAAIGGAISPALLVSDLGVPTRFLNMLRVFKVQSPMSVGSWTLVSFSSTAAAAALLSELERRVTRRRIPILTDAAEIGSALTGLLLATYTGVLIGATAIPAWSENVSLLPIHFGSSGISAAVSMLEL